MPRWLKAQASSEDAVAQRRCLLMLSVLSGEKPVTRRLHVAFVAPSRAHVHEFWRVGTEAGYRDAGPPGPRPQYSASYYGSFLLDPDGSSVEAVS